MKKKFAKLPKRAKRAAFANMNKDCALFKKSKTGKRTKSKGKVKCKTAWGIRKIATKKKARRAKRK